MKEFKKINTKDQATQQLQNSVAEYVSQITDVPLLDGRLIEGVAVSTTATTVNHGLGREARGYFIVKADVNVTIYGTPSTTPKTTLKITASASATVNIWVF